MLQSCRLGKPLLQSLHALQRSMISTTRLELNRIFALTQSFEYDQSNNNTQRRRGIMSTIGEYIGGALGLATDKNIDAIKDTLKHMYSINVKTAQSLDASGKIISQVVQTTNERFQAMHNLLEREHNISRILYNEFSDFGVNFEVSNRLVGKAIKYVTHYIENLEHISLIRQSLHDLVIGRISDDLISRELIQSELEALQKELGNTMSICHRDVSYYYRIATVRTFRQGDTLIVSVPVPMSHYAQRFSAIRIITVPLPTHTAGAGYMELKLTKSTILYSASAGVYMESKTPLDDSGITPYEQQAFHTLQPAAASNCLEAIIMHRSDQITDLCHFEYYHNATPTERMTRLDSRTVIVVGISQLKLSCSGQEMQLIQVKQITAVLKVDCNCDILSKTLFMPSISPNCSLNHPRLPRVVYNYNRLLLQSLFDKQKLDDMSDLQLHEAPIHVDMPSIELEAIEKELIMDSRQSVKLSQLTNNIVNQTKLYTDLSSYVYDKVVDAMLTNTAAQNDFSLFDYKSWLITISLMCGVISSIFLCLLDSKAESNRSAHNGSESNRSGSERKFNTDIETNA